MGKIKNYWNIIKQAVQVNSSSISDIEYDTKTQVMTVIFQNGRKYEYENVPANVHEQFTHAPSIGIFFNKNIRDNYRFKELL